MPTDSNMPIGHTLALGLGISLSFALLAIVYIHTPLPSFEIRANCIPTYPTFECPTDTYQAEKPNPVCTLDVISSNSSIHLIIVLDETTDEFLSTVNNDAVYLAASKAIRQGL